MKHFLWIIITFLLGLISTQELTTTTGITSTESETTGIESFFTANPTLVTVTETSICKTTEFTTITSLIRTTLLTTTTLTKSTVITSSVLLVSVSTTTTDVIAIIIENFLKTQYTFININTTTTKGATRIVSTVKTTVTSTSTTTIVSTVRTTSTETSTSFFPVTRTQTMFFFTTTFSVRTTTQLIFTMTSTSTSYFLTYFFRVTETLKPTQINSSTLRYTSRVTRTVSPLQPVFISEIFTLENFVPSTRALTDTVFISTTETVGTSATVSVNYLIGKIY